MKGLKLPEYRPGVKPNYAYFPVVFDGFARTRDQVFDGLGAHQIHPRKYFYPLINDFQCYEGRFSSKDTLPLYADLALEDVDRICGLLREMG